MSTQLSAYARAALEAAYQKHLCDWCQREIRMMCRLNTGWCSERCEEEHIAIVTKTPVGFE
jgi:hypothetical protein